MSLERDERWFGHPDGLSTLFFTEMWERFSYYGMRALLTLFMTAPVAMGGFGWSIEKAGPIYGLYTAMVYMTALPGGWIADRLIGQRKAVLIGAIVIMSGHISLMFHGVRPFYLGLFLIVIGTGFLKPNISALVGQLYTEDDDRRDSGFSIFASIGAGSSSPTTRTFSPVTSAATVLSCSSRAGTTEQATILFEAPSAFQ